MERVLMPLPVVPRRQVMTRLIEFSDVRLHVSLEKPSSRARTQRSYCNPDWVSFTAQ
jgi:hypothetical protein